MTENQTIPQELLRIGAVNIRPKQPYTWTSGLKSPIYCDNRLTMSFPEVRNQIINALVNMIKTYYPDTEVIAGTATAGIPHAAWVADRLNLPMVYIRSEAKKHGTGKQIEGTFEPGAKLVVIEDLISTGQSVIDAVNIAKTEGADVLGVAAIFTYELSLGQSAFDDLNIEFHTVTTYTSLVQAALQSSMIEEEDLDALEKWKNSPESWS
ncbi:orotate phosphoribosyltransferase [Alkalibacterium olivapovliticus]|uniref:Orotate phosphoribosyltransferase n=1 Tax=Alkalibacterium olivapovliticus TaxID=99907 RepID=A0A2T0WBG0_9LACT|nr:orotate phosphoribosyltransferase [Alkalibacterium olivapovliticus]PRY83864.1 orotate phosphoribosyltransferase [Alkalibacterium olivapovliticus]